MVADIPLLPESVHKVYYISRIGLQLPILITFFCLTYLPFYPKFHNQALMLGVLWITYANYWVIFQCWHIAQFAFPYEGILFYALYALIVLRLSFKYSLIYIVASIVGFAVLVTSYPIYAEYTGVKLGFVLFGLIVSLMSVYQIETLFNKFRSANGKLTVLSQIDQLTGIYNRGTFETKFYDMLNFAKRTQTTLAVFLFDLDNFKDFNDGYGHLKGDEVIRQQANILKTIFSRESDIIARYGGEEFIVATIDSSVEHCEKVAQKVITQWQQLEIAHGKGQGEAFVSCSIGFYCTKVGRYNTCDQLIENADKALYRAKATGKARFINGSSASC